MNNNYTTIIQLQNEFVKKVITHDNSNNIDNVRGIDVSYKDLNAFCSAVIVNTNNLESIEIVNEKSPVKDPYIQVLRMLREPEPLLKIVRLLKNQF